MIINEVQKVKFYTIKEIADELGIDKQKVYRYIKKKCINEAHQENGKNFYNEATKKAILKDFSQKDISTEAHQKHISETAFETVVNTLKKELETKNKQIEDLQKQNERLVSALEKTTESLKASQVLHATTIQQIEAPKSKGWFRRKREKAE